MMFKDLLANFCEGKLNEEVFKKQLLTFQSKIWKVGLVEEEFHLCVQIFLEFHKLDDSTQNQLLNCMLPRKKISAETAKAMLAWFFSNKGKCIKASQNLLSWFSVMLSSNLIDSKPFEKLINQFLVCFFWTELIPGICSVLKHILKPETVSHRTVFIASSYCFMAVNYPEKKHIQALLRLAYSCSPSLFPNPPTGKSSFTNSVSKFQKAVVLIAFEHGYLNMLPEFILSKSIRSVTINKCKALHVKKNLMDAEGNEAFLEAVNDLPRNGGLKYLGQMIKWKKLPAVQNSKFLLDSRIGQIYFSWESVVENKEMAEFTTSPDWRTILEVCQRIRNGWNSLPVTLSKFCIAWNGEENEEFVYNVIPFISCGSFEGLYQNVLCHLLNIFFTGTSKDKVNIIDCLTKMIANKVASESLDTIKKLIDVVSRLLKIALASDGLRSTDLLFSSLAFYLRISILEENYILGTWTIPPPFLVFGAFFSNNYLLISDVCELVVRHNIVMIPFYISVDMIKHFRDEEEIVKTYLRDLYLFLWKGQATNTELLSAEEDMKTLFSSKEMNSIFSVRSHFAIQHFIAYITSLGNLNRLNDQSILKVINTYAPGISSIKNAYEGSPRE